ncbi:hypothetical protein HQ590_12755 [bacterium]|nr:hypothetical protein [bacterium]
MTDEECKAFENGIWACDKCAREIDDNESRYEADELRRWKNKAEEYVEGLVTQDTRLRQLHVMMSPLLSTLRFLNALPGPGPTFDQTFESAGRIPVTRLLIEAEQTLFENGFLCEAEHLLRIQDELERVYNAIRSLSRLETGRKEHLDISAWKNQTIRTLMIDVMRFGESSYRRYVERESAMVGARRKELQTAAATVVPFDERGVALDAPPNGGPATPVGNSEITEGPPWVS